MSAKRSSSARKGPRLVLALAALAVLVALVWMVFTIGNPFPPRTIVMATGPEGSASHEFGARYRENLRRAGVDLHLLPTAGGVENLAHLRDPHSDVNVAIVECGLTSREESPGLVSLGTVSIEPFWTFLRPQWQAPTVDVAGALKGKRISIEPEGSAARVLAHQLLELNGVDTKAVEVRVLAPEQAADALLRNEIDAAFMLTSWQSPAVRKLLGAQGILLVRHQRADAYVALAHNLSKVVLPMGVVDLARNIPPTDVEMVAVTANLVVRKDLHPALQYLFLEAASEIHGGSDVFYRAGRFPAAETIDLPLSYQAREFYKSGRPFVYRYLPLWMAGLTERLLVVLIPLFVVVYPVVSFMPGLFAFFINRRIFNLYGELKVLELELERAGPGDAIQDVAAALEDLAGRANHLRVPLGYAQRLFILKSHITAAQEEVARRQRAGA